MPIENYTGLTINGLDENSPAGSEPMSDLDNHVRGVKKTVKYTFPNVTGQVTATHGQLSNPLLATTLATDAVPYYTSSSTAGTIVLSSIGKSMLTTANTTTACSLIQALPLVGGGLSGSLAITGNCTVTNNVVAAGVVSAPSLVVDANCNATITGGNPVFTVDTGDYHWFDRTNNTYVWSIGSANKMTLNSSGMLTVTDWTITSDARLKTDVEPIDPNAALDIVKDLVGVSFTYKDGNKPSFGFIAQQVEAVYPKAVETDENGFKSVRYAQTTALLVEAVKALTARVEALEGRQS